MLPSAAMLTMRLRAGASATTPASCASHSSSTCGMMNHVCNLYFEALQRNGTGTLPCAAARSRRKQHRSSSTCDTTRPPSGPSFREQKSRTHSVSCAPYANAGFRYN